MLMYGQNHHNIVIILQLKIKFFFFFGKIKFLKNEKDPQNLSSSSPLTRFGEKLTALAQTDLRSKVDNPDEQDADNQENSTEHRQLQNFPHSNCNGRSLSYTHCGP